MLVFKDYIIKMQKLHNFYAKTTHALYNVLFAKNEQDFVL